MHSQLLRSFDGCPSLYTLQAVSNSLWAYAKIGYKPGVMLLDVTALKAATMFHQYTSQEVANTLWALAALDHYPGSEMLSAAAIQLAKRLEHFTPQVNLIVMLSACLIASLRFDLAAYANGWKGMTSGQ